jgi:DHA2 family multidrug resistance protein
VIGVALLTIALGSMQYVLDEGERNDWFDDGRIVFFTVTFVTGLFAFILWELRGAKRPIVDLRIFRYGNVRFGTLTSILFGIVIFGPTVMMPQYVQGVLGFTATLSGLLVFMRALPVMLLTPLVARLATRYDFRWILVTGFVLSAASFAAIALHMTTTSEFGTFALLLAFSGVGQAMLLVPLLVGLLPSVAPEDAPKASSFISLSVQLGGSIASTMLVTIFDRRTYFHSDTLRGALTLARPAVEQLAQRHASTLSLARILQQQAVNAGFADAIFSLVPMACVGVFAVAAMRRVRAPLPGPIVLAE